MRYSLLFFFILPSLSFATTTDCAHALMRLHPYYHLEAVGHKLTNNEVLSAKENKSLISLLDNHITERELLFSRLKSDDPLLDAWGDLYRGKKNQQNISLQGVINHYNHKQLLGLKERLLSGQAQLTAKDKQLIKSLILLKMGEINLLQSTQYWQKFYQTFRLPPVRWIHNLRDFWKRQFMAFNGRTSKDGMSLYPAMLIYDEQKTLILISGHLNQIKNGDTSSESYLRARHTIEQWIEKYRSFPQQINEIIDNSILADFTRQRLNQIKKATPQFPFYFEIPSFQKGKLSYRYLNIADSTELNQVQRNLKQHTKNLTGRKGPLKSFLTSRLREESLNQAFRHRQLQLLKNLIEEQRANHNLTPEIRDLTLKLMSVLNDESLKPGVKQMNIIDRREFFDEYKALYRGLKSQVETVKSSEYFNLLTEAQMQQFGVNRISRLGRLAGAAIPTSVIALISGGGFSIYAFVKDFLTTNSTRRAECLEKSNGQKEAYQNCILDYIKHHRFVREYGLSIIDEDYTPFKVASDDYEDFEAFKKEVRLIWQDWEEYLEQRRREQETDRQIKEALNNLY